MSDYTLEQKLVILEKMKQEQAKNEFTLGQRRPTTIERNPAYTKTSVNSNEHLTSRSLGKLRFLFALFLLLGFLFLHFTGFSYKTFQAGTIENLISDDFSLKEAKDFLKNIEKNLDFL